MNEFILGLACFTIGVLISSIIWVIVLDRVTENAPTEDKVIREVIDQLKTKNQEKSDEED